MMKIAIFRMKSISAGLQSSGVLSVMLRLLMNPSMLLNESDHPIIEKNEEIKPSQPSKTVPVCRLKQRNPSRTSDDDGIIKASYQLARVGRAKM